MDDVLIKSVDCDIRVMVDGEALGDVAAALAAAERAEAAAASLGWLAPDRIFLAALNPSFRAAYLMEDGREGVFTWQAQDLSAFVTVDTMQGVFVPPTGQDGSNGCWVRDNYTTVLATWFGAKPDGITDNTSFLRAMLNFVFNFGGVARFNSGGVDRYMTQGLRVQGPNPKRFHIECDPNTWLVKATLTHFNLLDIYTCEYVTLGNLNFDCRIAEDPPIWDPLTDTTTGENIGYGLTIRDSSYISHTGKIRVVGMHNGVLVYSNVPVKIPVYHDVVLDHLELRCPIELDDEGHVLSGGWSNLGMLFANMADSGVRFIDVEGVMTKNPGFAVELKVDCHRCWFAGFKVRQSWLAVSALGGGIDGDDTDPVDAKNCWFGPGLVDQCVSAVSMSHAQRVTFAHIRARHHPDLKWGTPELAAPGATGSFINFSGNSSDCTAIVEIIDYDGGPDNVPPIYVGGDRNMVIVPTINDNIPVYATIPPGADHCQVAIWHDTTLGAGPNMLTKFDNQSAADTNIFSVNGGSFNWRVGVGGGAKIDTNEISTLLDADGDANNSGKNYLSLQAEHFTATGIQLAVPATGFAFIVGGHIEQVILEPVGALASGAVHFPGKGRGRRFTLMSTQNITTVSWITPDALAIVGAPAGLTANTPVRFIYLDDTDKWYRA